MFNTMLKKMAPEFRYRLQYPVEYRLGLLKAGLGRAVNSRAGTVRFLIASDRLVPTSEEQFTPLHDHAGPLRRQLGVVFSHMRLAEAMRLGRAEVCQFHAIGLKISFQTPESEAIRIVSHFRDQTSGAATKLVYFDGDDDVCVQWPAVLRLVDLYVKKGVFSSDADYMRQFAGKSNLTDFVSKVYGVPAPSDIPKSGVLEPSDLPKLHLGWSTALDQKHTALFRKIKPLPPEKKDVDILCRASLPNDWSQPLRSSLLPHLETLRDRRRLIVSVPTSRVPWEQYYDELLRSRICVSPYGYGEVCGRDIEATLAGCLLVKPDMSHLRSHPDIFSPGVSYIAVQRDYKDLAETCEYYLDHEEERARIAANAYRVLADSYRADAFVETFAGVLERLGLSSGQPFPA
jgi:Glycosyl transferases group 1